MATESLRSALAQALKPHIDRLHQDLDLVEDGGIDTLDRSWKLCDKAFPYSCTDEEGMILFHLITGNGLKSGYEVATAFGYSSAYLGLAFKSTSGRLQSMDCYVEEWKESFRYHPSELTKAYGEVTDKLRQGAYPSGLRFAVEHAAKLGLGSTVQFATGISPQDVPQTLEDRRLDFAFIDGGHDGDQPTLDLQAVLPFLEEKCLLIFHDNNDNIAVERAVQAAERHLGTRALKLPTRYNLTLVGRGLDNSVYEALPSLLVRDYVLPQITEVEAVPENISFVVQGAVSRSGPAATQDVCASIRAHFPGAEIVLSTWANQDVQGIDFDQLVLSPDPGALPYIACQNTNRQIVGSLAGVKKASRPLVIKTRTDVLFQSSAVLDYWDRWTEQGDELRIFQKRVLTPNVFARKPSQMAPLPMHPSDWCFFGLKSDLLFLFDIPLLTLENAVKIVAPNTMVTHYAPEQYLWLSAIRKKNPDIAWAHSWCLTPELQRLTEVSFANNLAILDTREQFGISCPKYAEANRDFRDFTLYQHDEWLELYHRICAAGCHDSSVDLQDLVTDEFAQWALNDPRIAGLRSAGFSWEAQLVECSIVGPTMRRDHTTDPKQEKRFLDSLVGQSASERVRLELTQSRKVAQEKEPQRRKNNHPSPDRLNIGEISVSAYPPGRHGVFQMRPAKVTVCVPVYNAGPVLSRCLDSIVRQSYADFQVIVVDNGSTDGTYESCKSYADENSNFLVYRNTSNIGRIPNWNRCLDLAQGEYVKPVLVNDYLLPGTLDNLAWTMDRYPSVTLARSALYYLGADGATHLVQRMPSSMVLPSQIAREMGMLQHNICDVPSAQILRRAPVEALKLRFDEQFHWSADFEFAQRVLQHGDFCYVQEAGVVMDMTIPRFATGSHGLLQYKEDVACVLRSYRAMGARPEKAEAIVQRLQRECEGQKSRTPEQEGAIMHIFAEALGEVKQFLMQRAA